MRSIFHHIFIWKCFLTNFQGLAVNQCLGASVFWSFYLLFPLFHLKMRKNRKNVPKMWKIKFYTANYVESTNLLLEIYNTPKILEQCLSLALNLVTFPFFSGQKFFIVEEQLSGILQAGFNNFDNVLCFLQPINLKGLTFSLFCQFYAQ